MIGLLVFSRIFSIDGIFGIFSGFGMFVIGLLFGRVLVLILFEVLKDMIFKYMENMNMSELIRIGIVNGVVGMIFNLVFCLYFVFLDVVGILIFLYFFSEGMLVFFKVLLILVMYESFLSIFKNYVL